MITVDLQIPDQIPSLPQKETLENQAIRKQELEGIQKKYQLSSKNYLTIPLLELPIPVEEMFDNKYNSERGAATLPMTKNETIIKSHIKEPFSPFSGFLDYEQMYLEIPKPEVILTWMTDESFGEQRLSGVNPGMIKRVKSKENLPKILDLKQLDSILGVEDSLSSFIHSKILYYIDYTDILKEVTGGKIEIQGAKPIQKYLPKPIALFVWKENAVKSKDPIQKNGRFLPLAIQIDLDHLGKYKIFTPNHSPLLWTIAKLCFSIADTNVHEMSTHLGRSHFALESFGAITPRQLSPKHPLFILLKPHLRFLVWNNQKGMERLVQTNGPVDRLLAGHLNESVQIACNAAKQWSVLWTFTQDIMDRGVNEESVLPHYPYRDDALLIWEAIHKYVDEYIRLYYKNAKDIEEDYELQNWSKELSSKEQTGGQVNQMPTQIQSIEKLVDILTTIIFSSSAGHTAVNFTQYPYVGFTPNAPLAGYADYQEFLAKNNTTEKEQLDFMMKFLPPPFLALGQIGITNSLSIYHYDQLGDYGNQFADSLAKLTLYRFVQNLQLIEQRIKIRNKSRIMPYTFLLPSQILNSASI